MKYTRNILFTGLTACALILSAVPDAAARDDRDRRGRSYDKHDRDRWHSSHRGRYDDRHRYSHRYGHRHGGYVRRPSTFFGLSITSVQRPVVRTVAPVYAYSGRQVVADVQSQLNRRGYGAGRVDGILGGQTRRAIASFQSRNGLYPSGGIDEPLLRALRLI